MNVPVNATPDYLGRIVIDQGDDRRSAGGVIGG